MADKSKNIKEQMFVWLSKEIYDADQKGVKVTVDGSFYSPADVGRLQNVMENHYYINHQCMFLSVKIRFLQS